MMYKSVLFVLCMIILACSPAKKLGVRQHNMTSQPFAWESSTIYFLIPDRFYNGDPSNDYKHPDSAPPAPLRGFMGGDIKGITKKINEGYFSQLGVDAIWTTPLVQNIDGSVDEGTGTSYPFHGYWTKDWTAIDSRLGTKEDLKEMVKAAHAKGIKVILDVVINHTGPITPLDVKWPDDWVRTGPRCTYKDYKTTTACTLVDNLPDILTESTTEVGLPPHLVEKWKKEGRFEKEIASLDTFFKRTGYPRLPYFYIIKWLTDWIEEFKVDGYRVDTAKHLEEQVWKYLREEADYRFKKAKKQFPEDYPEDNNFFMFGEVYGYNLHHGRWYDFGDKKVDYYQHGFDALINFGHKYDAKESDGKSFFGKYDKMLHDSPLEGFTTVHYLSSHDDGEPFDKERTRSLESATKMLLSQGAVQIYYGDEVGRTLMAAADGDAKLRSPMEWEKHQQNNQMLLLDHWQKLGQFRKANPAVGGGRHHDISDAPYIFARTYKSGSYSNKVVLGLDLPMGKKIIPVAGYFEDGDSVYDYYSKTFVKVSDGKVTTDNPFSIVLLGPKIR